MRLRRRAFTLVELLVVIAIIGILVSLLIPAVNYAVNTARKAQCLSNMRQVGQAMLEYQTTKQVFPPSVSLVQTGNGQLIDVTWLMKILPGIEKGNVWDQILLTDPSALASGPPPFAVDIAEFACPSDPPLTDTPGHNSYVVNTGTLDAYNCTSPTQLVCDLKSNGVCHDLARLQRLARREVREQLMSQLEVDASYISSNDGTSTTLLVSENVDATWWYIPTEELGQPFKEGFYGMVWTNEPEGEPKWFIGDPSFAATDSSIADVSKRGLQFPINKFHGSVSFPDRPADLLAIARPSSYHSGGVNVVYCDGHADFLSDEVDVTIYGRLLTPAGAQARNPLGANQPVLWQRVPLSDKDF